MRLTLIAAVARNGTLGRDNDLVWRESADQAHFRDTTRGHAVVMGRKTWESLPAKVRPLPGRHNVVVTRNRDFNAAGADTVHSLDEALARLKDAPEVFVIGGAQLYAQALPLADRLVLTEIDAELPGDIFFPAWSREHFVEVQRQAAVSAAGVPYAFVNYERRVAPRLSPGS